MGLSVWMIVSAFWYVFGLVFIFSYYEMLKPFLKSSERRRIIFHSYRVVVSNLIVDMMIVSAYYIAFPKSFEMYTMLLLAFKGSLMVAVFWKRKKMARKAVKARNRDK